MGTTEILECSKYRPTDLWLVLSIMACSLIVVCEISRNSSFSKDRLGDFTELVMAHSISVGAGGKRRHLSAPVETSPCTACKGVRGTIWAFDISVMDHFLFSDPSGVESTLVCF